METVQRPAISSSSRPPVRPAAAKCIYLFFLTQAPTTRSSAGSRAGTPCWCCTKNDWGGGEPETFLYWLGFARFMPPLLKGETLPGWGLSSLRVEFSIANSLSCCLLYKSCDSSCIEGQHNLRSGLKVCLETLYRNIEWNACIQGLRTDCEVGKNTLQKHWVKTILIALLATTG